MSDHTKHGRRCSADRRSGVDRRQVDVGPRFGERERRRRPDPRKPEVEEIALSDAEWERAFGKPDGAQD